MRILGSKKKRQKIKIVLMKKVVMINWTKIIIILFVI